MTQRFSAWRRGRGWPTGGQLGLAIVVGLVVAVFIGVLTRHDGPKAAEPSTSTTTIPASTSTARVSSTTRPPVTHPATTVTPTTRTPPPANQLVPLTIAAASHTDSYSRDNEFGDWIDVDGCQDTRATLLIHTSLAPITFTTAKECTVKTGKWVDPWSGAVTTVAHTFQIDHTVPLANAWRSGAWSWTQAQRVAYTNDLADKDHLVPILGAENESKGDRGPDEWRPPARGAWCRYALDWDHIKAKWHLSTTQSEWAAIEQMVHTC